MGTDKGFKVLAIREKCFDDRINELSGFLKNRGYEREWELEKRTLEILKRKAITFTDNDISLLLEGKRTDELIKKLKQVIEGVK